MRLITAQAAELVDALDRAVEALRFQLELQDAASTETLETRLDGLLVQYRTLLEEITPIRPADPVDPRYEPFFRCAVAFATIIGLLSSTVGKAVQISWGDHVFSDADFVFVGYEKLPTGLPEKAVLRILPDQVSDLRSAVAEILRTPTPLGYKNRVRIEQNLKTICALMKCPAVLSHSLGMDLADAQWVKDELQIDDSELESLVRTRKIISVPTWSGGRAFPTFQVRKKKIIKSVAVVCENAAPSFKDWPLAIWLARNQNETKEYFAEKLGDLGLWKPLWAGKPSGKFKGIRESGQAEVVGPLFRVSRSQNSPFYFSSVEPARPSDGGRFDLAAGTGAGALYAAESKFGAWSETLDRHPVVTLHELYQRTIWEIKPTAATIAADLTQHSVALAATNRRPDTQAVAAAFFNKGWKALRVGLRSRQHETGLVIFGRLGPNLPATAGIGLWSSTRRAGIDDISLWEYIEAREKLDEAFPVVLRRFPTEMRFGRLD